MLPVVLAQLTPEMFGPTVTWLAGASAVLLLLNQALNFYKNHIKEQPEAARTYATKLELKQVHGRIAREREEINEVLRGLQSADQRLSSRLDQDIKELSQQMVSIPATTINLLRTTKGLIE